LGIIDKMISEALFYSKIADGKKVICNLCPHQCVISPEHTGICKVRKNIGGILYAMNYFKFSAISLDPIEKKPLNMFYPGSGILSLGSVGCNLRCPFCQNHDIATKSVEYDNTFSMSADEVIGRAIELKNSGNIGIAYTYNEPTVWIETILDLAEKAKKHNLKNVLVTNGFINPKPLQKILPFIDAMNIDLKAFDEDTYKTVMGGNLENVLDTIRESADKCHVEVTTLIIPGINDSIEEIKKLSEFLKGVDENIVLHLSRFFPKYKWSHMQPTDIKLMYKLAFEAQKHLKNVTLGNI